MKQYSLFRHDTQVAFAPADQVLALEHSASLLMSFEGTRIADGAHPQSVRREVSQLRALLREATKFSPSVTVQSLFTDLDLLAHVLRDPSTVISRATGRVRLLAAQRFIQVVGPSLGRHPDSDLADLDARLPTRRSPGWHASGVLVAGKAGRCRRRGPTLDVTDLQRLVNAAGADGGSHVRRDRVLVALHCFSGLHPQEIVHLRWQDLNTELTTSGHYGLTAAVHRGGRRMHVFLPPPASTEIEALADSLGQSIPTMSGPVLSVRSTPGRPLSYRAARDVVDAACRSVGLPPMDSASLRAACAHWLRSQGLSDHEVADVLGLTRVRSVDRLLQRHDALDAQRTVREALFR